MPSSTVSEILFNHHLIRGRNGFNKQRLGPAFSAWGWEKGNGYWGGGGHGSIYLNHFWLGVLIWWGIFLCLFPSLPIMLRGQTVHKGQEESWVHSFPFKKYRPSVNKTAVEDKLITGLTMALSAPLPYLLSIGIKGQQRITKHRKQSTPVSTQEIPNKHKSALKCTKSTQAHTAKKSDTTLPQQRNNRWHWLVEWHPLSPIPTLGTLLASLYTAGPVHALKDAPYMKSTEFASHKNKV